MWEFSDNTGQEIRTARRPERVVAYVRAAAALQDLGVPTVAAYGSGHDTDRLDPAKAGTLSSAGVPYLGPGGDVTDEALHAVRPDLIVDVTYDGKAPYGLDAAPAQRLGIPLLALAVADVPLLAILERFGALAATLRPGGREEGGSDEFENARRALREAVGSAAPSPRVLALSGAGPDQVHLARPEAWPELQYVSDLGVALIDPGPGGGTSWLTTDWEQAARLRPDLLLVDGRANAVPPGEEYVPGAKILPWNPETPPSPAAYARFLRSIADALG